MKGLERKVVISVIYACHLIILFYLFTWAQKPEIDFFVFFPKALHKDIGKIEADLEI